MNASVVICTYNRAQSLKRTLQSIQAMDVPPHLSWELIIVDNNSSDETRSVAEAFIEGSGVNARYSFEGRQGLSYARNRGVKEAAGTIIAFTDDDVIVDAHWLGNIAAAFEASDAACIGGKIMPLWAKPCPQWLTEDFFWYLALLDRGERRIRLSEPHLWGANFAVRASLFAKYGYFNTAAGRIGDKLYAGEETQFIRKLIEGGESVYYIPDIKVHHYIPEQRMKKKYFRRTIFSRGEQLALADAHRDDSALLKVVLYQFGVATGKLWKYVQALFTSERCAFSRQLDLIGNIGYIAGRLKFRRREYSSAWQRFKRGRKLGA
ncbi:MAG: glycosyltransferase [Nitrospirota bacterium]